MRKELSYSPKLKIILLVLLVCFLVYVLVLQPIIAWAWLAPIEYRGVELYTNNTYLLFDDGIKFRDAINSLPFVEECTIVDFYYYDTFLRDNLFYGKMCDTYVLELHPDGNYKEIKEEIISLSTHDNELDDYDLYLLSDSAVEADWTVVGMNDATATIRCIMITDMEKSDLYGFSRALIRQTNLNWEGGRGDGLREPQQKVLIKRRNKGMTVKTRLLKFSFYQFYSAAFTA